MCEIECQQWSLKGGVVAILFTPPLILAGIRRNPGIPSESVGIQEFRWNGQDSGWIPIHSAGIKKKNYTTQNRSIIYKRNYHKRNYRVTILGKIQKMMLTTMNDTSFIVWVPCRFQRHGTWFKLKKIQRKYCIMYVW